MPTRQVLKEVYDRWYAKAILHLAKQEWGEAKLCLNTAAKAMSDIAAKAPQGEIKDLEQAWLFDLAAELEHLEKKLMVEGSKEKLQARREEEASEELPAKFPEKGIPNTTFEDVVGLEDAKRSVFFKAIYPRLYPELYTRYRMKTGGGLLLYGLPGTGKTMIAQAVAHETKAKFFAVRCSDVGSKWFGETEQNIRAIFEEARSYDNAVLFFDEIEAYAGKRREDSAMSRVVPEFLTQLQGVYDNPEQNKLLVIAATNRPWDIDGAFLRPGRFDDRIYVPLPDAAAREVILKNKMADVPTSTAIDFRALSVRMENYNGADTAYVCDKAKEIALRRIIERLEDDTGVTPQDFEEALSQVKSSVDIEDKVRMEQWENGMK